MATAINPHENPYNDLPARIRGKFINRVEVVPHIPITDENINTFYLPKDISFPPTLAPNIIEATANDPIIL